MEDADRERLRGRGEVGGEGMTLSLISGSRTLTRS